MGYGGESAFADLSSIVPKAFGTMEEAMVGKPSFADLSTEVFFDCHSFSEGM
jgi:hypothetical protein